MVEYTLPKSVKGEELIAVLEKTAEHFDYRVETKPLKETNPNIATLGWRLFGSFLDENWRYNDIPIREVDSRIKSVRIYDKQPIPRGRLVEGLLPMEAVLWTAEAILDLEDTYKALSIEMYKGDGLVYSHGWRFIHIARAKPLKADNGMLAVKPVIDNLVGKVKEILSE